ncbi:MAG: 3-dehydroquinate synthase family protein [Acidimicrobiales bacterium]
MIVVPVELGSRSYDVVIGSGARRLLRRLVAGTGAGRAVVVTQRSVEGWVSELDPGVPFDVQLLDDGEAAKSLATIERLCRAFAAAGLARSDVVVAVGGGVVTDVAGFAAATFHRGVAYVNVATSLLGQVDAAVGGKTGVNVPEGKNLVGAFWQPHAVLCDTDVLSTLPTREWACGRGEMAKYAFLGDEPLGASLAGMPLDEQVATCVRLKASVVSSDEREGGGRALLNYGHTLAHALEAASFDGGGDLRHGEAVAIGLVFAALLARRLGRVDDHRVAEHRAVVGAFGLPAALPPERRGQAEAERLVGFMARDKKAAHDLTFVLDGPDGVEVVHGVEPADVLATLAEMGAER